MKKRLFSLLLILALALGLCTAVHAEELHFVYDESGVIDAEDERVLEDLGGQIYAETGTAVCVCFVEQTGDWDELRSFSESFYGEHIGAGDGILLVQFRSADGDRLSFYKVGDRLASLNDEDLNAILDAYRGSDSYFDGARSYMNMVYARLRGATAFGEVTPEENPNIPEERQLDRVADLAGVIDEERLRTLNALADEISETYQCDVTVAFVPSLEGKYIVDYADDFYDYKGYGYGPNDDGILLLISVGDREFAETTYGYGKTAFPEDRLTRYLEPRFTPFLGENDWAGGAEQFIRDAGVLLKQAREDPGNNNTPSPQPARRSFKETAPLAAVISAVIGFFSGGIPAGSMKRKMKSVEK
ncbi:MAG: TPM domain-containing protein, partial [Oscillospiraceae bacterium]|nr:TPM domain-containing protein [Oscillospiraceae bacterium]